MKICVIGAGRMGRRHISAARNAGFSIAGVFDQSSEAISATLSECGVLPEQIYAEPAQMLTACKPDAVVVATTAPSHHDYVRMAADAGVKHVLCEKPMASSIEQCDRMIAACRNAGTALAVNHQMRFMEQYTAIRELVNAPEFGGLRSMVVTAGNFGLAMNGSHYFEAFRYLTDEAISDVSCRFDPETVPNPRGPQFVDRSGQLRATSASGARFILECGGDLGHGVTVVYGCRFGQIVVDELSGSLRGAHRQADYRNLPSTRYGMPSVTVERQIAPADVLAPTEALWSAMLDGKSYPDGATGRHAVAALVAANLSGEQDGVVVRLDDNLPVSRSFMWA